MCSAPESAEADEADNAIYEQTGRRPEDAEYVPVESPEVRAEQLKLREEMKAATRKEAEIRAAENQRADQEQIQEHPGDPIVMYVKDGMLRVVAGNLPEGYYCVKVFQNFGDDRIGGEEKVYRLKTGDAIVMKAKHLAEPTADGPATARAKCYRVEKLEGKRYANYSEADLVAEVQIETRGFDADA